MKTTIKLLSIVLCTVFLTANVFADAEKAVKNLVGGYGVNQLQKTPTALFKQTKDSFFNTLVGPVVTRILDPNVQTSVTSTNPMIGQNRKAPPTRTGAEIFNRLTNINPASTINSMMSIPVPAAAGQKNVAAEFLGGESPSESVQNVNANMLLVPIQYDKEQQKSALNVIKFLSGSDNPLPVIDYSNVPPDKLKKALKNNAELQEYLIALRSLVSQQSVAFSNLFYLYAERVPQNTKGLADKIKDLKKTKLYPKASALAIDNYMANRRFTDKNWNTTIQKLATPAELQRQQIYIMRDMLRQLYKLNMLNERILLTMTIIEQQGTAAARIRLNQLYSKVAGSPPFSSDSSSDNSSNGGGGAVSIQ